MSWRRREKNTRRYRLTLTRPSRNSPATEQMRPSRTRTTGKWGLEKTPGPVLSRFPALLFGPRFSNPEIFIAHHHTTLLPANCLCRWFVVRSFSFTNCSRHIFRFRFCSRFRPAAECTRCNTCNRFFLCQRVSRCTHANMPLLAELSRSLCHVGGHILSTAIFLRHSVSSFICWPNLSDKGEGDAIWCVCLSVCLSVCQQADSKSVDECP